MTKASTRTPKKPPKIYAWTINFRGRRVGISLNVEGLVGVGELTRAQAERLIKVLRRELDRIPPDEHTWVLEDFENNEVRCDKCELVGDFGNRPKTKCPGVDQ